MTKWRDLPLFPVRLRVFSSELQCVKKEGGFFKISVRTNNNINASDFCSQFGGGGHPAAAGCSIEGDLETVKTTLEKAAEKFLS